MVCNGAYLTSEVLTLDMVYEAVRVCETESQLCAKIQQQAIVIKLVHHELRKFQYGTTCGNWFRQHHICKNFPPSPGLS